MKNNIDELNQELILLKGDNINKNNNYYNASFINNSIINTNSIPKYKHNMVNPILMKTYSSFNRYNTEHNFNSNYKNKDLIYEYNQAGLNNDNSRSKYNRMVNSNNSSRNKNYKTILISNPNPVFHTNNTQEFINKNKEEDKNHIKFLREYKKTLENFQTLK